MINKAKLSNCPFCGKTVSIAKMDTDGFDYYGVHGGRGKNECHCRVFMESNLFSKDDQGEKEYYGLVEKWNRRINS